MLNLGVNLAIFGFVGAILINVIMLIKFPSRANRAGPVIAEIFHTLLMGGLRKSYLTLLSNDGIEPTLADELLYRFDIVLKLAFFVGLTLVAVGLFMTS
jgi:hypothetical protein